MRTHKTRLQRLKDTGYTPQGILDIGAHTGEWSKMAHDIFPETPILIIEGNSDHTEILNHILKSITVNSPKSKLLIELISDHKKEVTYYKTTLNGTTGNSIYKENSTHFSSNNVIEEKRITTTLDQTTKNIGTNYDFIKIDVQGSEADIIKGGKQTIQNANYILVEAQLIEYNKKAPFIDEIIKLLSELSFRMVDIFEIHYLPDGRLNEIDILFTKNNNSELKISNKNKTKNNIWLKYDICINRETPKKMISQILKRTFNKKLK
ncbi:MAG: FkbM family methyltransferase [Candidatus Marinimicrobia bacterium]|jgi:FkbM family methyltransferase|nr:FkbM family methyltransferase [Candidatus Neomarinimicrobiota bacterium]MBT7830678.1 FkbM family methyltransferase [Candidatus Neomarinimicrobiota bacterium]